MAKRDRKAKDDQKQGCRRLTKRERAELQLARLAALTEKPKK